MNNNGRFHANIHNNITGCGHYTQEGDYRLEFYNEVASHHGDDELPVDARRSIDEDESFTTTGPVTGNVNQPGQVHYGFIKFPILNELCCDAELDKLYPEAHTRGVATLVRDVQIVTTHHLDKLHKLGVKFVPRSGTHPLQRRPPTCIECYFGDVLNQFEGMKKMISRTVVGSGEWSGIPASAPTPLLNNLSHNAHADMQLWTANWPRNTCKKFLSKMLVRYAGMKQTIGEQLPEVADYCIARHPMLGSEEIIFHDGTDLVLHRREMYDMEAGVVIHPSVINSWSRVVNARDQHRGLTHRCCLNLVDMRYGELSESVVLHNWLIWLQSGELNLKKAKLIFIPVQIGYHYHVIVLNFYKYLVHSIDTLYHLSDHLQWDAISQRIAQLAFVLLERIGDPRAKDVHNFGWEVLNPTWSTTFVDNDSGISVMHFMEGFYGELTDLDENRMNEGLKRMTVRIKMTAIIVFSFVNLYKANVLSKIPRFIRHKCTDELSPSEEVIEYQRSLNY